LYKLKVVKVGDGLGIVLPGKVLALLKVGNGDWIELTESGDGFLIRKHYPEL
jgi:antitoxin component of MazEF toxin-antitoxin module